MAMGMGMMQRHPEMKGNLNVDPQIDRGGLARVPWVTARGTATFGKVAFTTWSCDHALRPCLLAPMTRAGDIFNEAVE